MTDFPYTTVSTYYTPEYRAALAEIERRRALVKAAQQDFRAAVLAALDIENRNEHLLPEPVEATP